MPAMAHRGAYPAVAHLGLEERPGALPKVVGRTGVVFDSRPCSRPKPLIVGSAPMCPIPRPCIVLPEGAAIEINWRTVCYGKKPVGSARPKQYYEAIGGTGILSKARI